MTLPSLCGELRPQEGKSAVALPMPAALHGWRLCVRTTATAVYSGLRQAPDSGQTLTVLFNAVPAQPPLGTVEEQLHQGPQGRASSQHMLLVPGAAAQTLLPQAALALQPARPLILAAPKPISEHPARLF